MGSIWTRMEEGLSRLQDVEAVEQRTYMEHTSYCFLYHELSLLTQKGFLEEEEFLGCQEGNQRLVGWAGCERSSPGCGHRLCAR